jgi:hypothetical protein
MRLYVYVEKTSVFELEESGFLAECITDIFCSNTKFVNVDSGGIDVFRFTCVCTRKLSVSIRVHANFAGQEVIGLEYQILNNEVDISILILDSRNWDITNQRHSLRQHNVNYCQSYPERRIPKSRQTSNQPSSIVKSSKTFFPESTT